VINQYIAERLEGVRPQREEANACLAVTSKVVALTQATLQTDGASFLAHMPEVSARVKSCIAAGQPILQTAVPSSGFSYPVQSVDGKSQPIGNIATSLSAVLATLSLELAMSELPPPINLAELDDLVVTAEMVLAPVPNTRHFYTFCLTTRCLYMLFDLTQGRVHRFRSITIRRGGVLTTTAWDGETVLYILFITIHFVYHYTCCLLLYILFGVLTTTAWDGETVCLSLYILFIIIQFCLSFYILFIIIHVLFIIMHVVSAGRRLAHRRGAARGD
jgi:hypothetical protein